MKVGLAAISFALAALWLSAAGSAVAQTPTPSPTSLSPDKKWQYDCAESIPYECFPQLVNAGTNEIVLDLERDVGVYSKYSKRANIVWAPDSKRFAFNFAEVASHAYFATTAFYELHGDKWERLASLANDDSPISKAVSKAISDGATVERRKKHIKGKAASASGGVKEVREWTDPDTAIVYAYEEYSDETETIRVDFLFTLKFDKAGKLKIVKTQKLSEEESQKYTSPGID